MNKSTVELVGISTHCPLIVLLPFFTALMSNSVLIKSKQSFLLSLLPDLLLSMCHTELLYELSSYQINMSTSHHQACSHRWTQWGWRTLRFGIAGSRFTAVWLRPMFWCWIPVGFISTECEWFLSTIKKYRFREREKEKERGRKKNNSEPLW